MKKWFYVALLTAALNVYGQYGEGIPQFTPSSSSGLQSGTVGWAFQPTTDFEITHLGAFAFAISDNSGVLNVGLWNSSGVNLASVRVTAGSALFNSSRYSSIAPVMVLAGQVYHIGAYSDTDVIGINTVGPQIGGFFTNSPLIQYLGFAQSSSTNSAPLLTPGGSALLYAGPNFMYPIPEPAALALGFLAVGSFLLARRVRRP